ncbi:MAG TPA: M20/M25/M40 family metallo-hydrolase [Bryobacteraceae bacterium]|nr:M20/M25/M40 family metallo-hydrolase [Bryobacteraceae bacterium]
MSVVQLTRALIDIESVTGNEQAVANYLYEYLARLAARTGGRVEQMEVEPKRFNVFAQWGDPLIVTLSTHMDTVPPFFASSENETHIWGRGACDTKGIIAAMIRAAEALLAEGQSNFGLLFVVGEERNSAGAHHAAKNPRGSRYIINGEPTENLLAIGSKGALRYEVHAGGKMAHSAYPELGDSAVHKLVEVLADMLHISLPVDPLLGPSTLNIGTITGGYAPNVVADEASAEVFIRLVGDSAPVRQAIERAVHGRAQLLEILEIPALRLGSLDGMETTVVAFTTDIPAFSGAWGEPFLIGPGSIHVAHSLEEHILKSELERAVGIYQNMVRQLCKRASK